MKEIKKISVFLGLLFLVSPLVQAGAIFDIGAPGVKKVDILIEVAEDTTQNKNFTNGLKRLLESSLLFQITDSKENADFIATLSGSIESNEVILSISATNENTFETTGIGVRFSKSNKDYLELKAAQLGNRMIAELFGLQGPLGSTIVYSLDLNGKKIIYKDTFGISNQQQRVNYNFSSNFNVSYSPDGRKIVYNRLTDKGNQIMIQQIRPLKLNALNVYYNEGKSSAPFWAPDGSIFLTLHESARNSNIYKFITPENLFSLKNPQLKQIKKLTSDSSIETEPRISPDGEKMAYVSDRTGSPQIYILDLATGKSQRFSKIGKYNVTPVWSPNGRFIAFTGIRQSVSSIYRIEVNTGEELRITPSDLNAETPTWSPDSSLIAFTGKRRLSKTKIYYSLMNGSGYKRLTQSDDNTAESWPSWGMALR